MDFYRRVAAVCAMIPRGRAVTYGQIALLCGKPRNARQVGYALRRNLAGDVPAHRVVNSQGILSGAAAFESPDRQKRLLEAEGITVIVEEGVQKVDLARFGWRNTMEDALKLRDYFEEMNI